MLHINKSSPLNGFERYTSTKELVIALMEQDEAIEPFMASAAVECWLGWLFASMQLEQGFAEVMQCLNTGVSSLLRGPECLSRTRRNHTDHCRTGNYGYFLLVFQEEDTSFCVYGVSEVRSHF